MYICRATEIAFNFLFNHKLWRERVVVSSTTKPFVLDWFFFCPKGFSSHLTSPRPPYATIDGPVWTTLTGSLIQRQSLTRRSEGRVRVRLQYVFFFKVSLDDFNPDEVIDTVRELPLHSPFFLQVQVNILTLPLQA